jgi:hypothetical protein
LWGSWNVCCVCSIGLFTALIDYEKLLQTYTLDEIIEYNDLTGEDVLVWIDHFHRELKYPPLPT